MYNAVSHVAMEHITNFKRILKLGYAHSKKETLGSTYGMGWTIFKDIIYFGVFILFRYLMSGSKEIDGMNFILYLITGLIPWFHMNNVINSGTHAIKKNAAIIKSINFPITTLPTIEVISIFINRSFSIIIGLIVLAIFGDIASFNLIKFLYFHFSMMIFMVGFNLVFSAFIAISVDFQHLYSAFTRVVFYSLPILWSFNQVASNTIIIRILKLNPMVYIVEGYRQAYVTNIPINIKYTTYFWMVTIVLLTLGGFIQYKLRKYYSDFI